MNRYEVGMLAISKAGHDLNHIYVVVKEEGEYVFLSDGRIRTLDRPKKKKKKHIQPVCEISSIIADKISSGKKIENEDIKRIIKLYSAKKNG